METLVACSVAGAARRARTSKECRALQDFLCTMTLGVPSICCVCLLARRYTVFTAAPHCKTVMTLSWSMTLS